MERIKYLDFAKGIAILLVVLAHCIQTFVPGWQINGVELGILMFHMPLFIFISGLFFPLSFERISMGSFIHKKFLRLYLPSLCWGLVSIIILGMGKIIITKTTIELMPFVKIFFTGAWFLTALFLLSAIGAFIHKSFGKYFFIGWLGFYSIVYLSPSFWMVNEMKFLMPFFALAIIVKASKIEVLTIPYFIIAVITFIVCFSFYSFSSSLYEMTDNVFAISYHTNTMLRFFSGLSGSIITLYLCKKLYYNNLMIKCITYLGTITLPIYVLHQKFLMLNLAISFNTDSMLFCLLMAVIVILISIQTYKTLSHWPILSALLFGDKYENRSINNSIS